MVAGLGGRTTAPKIGLLRREEARKGTPAWDGRRESGGSSRTRNWGGKDMCSGGPARGWRQTKRGRENWRGGPGCAGRQQKLGGLLSASASTCPSLDRGSVSGAPEPPRPRGKAPLRFPGTVVQDSPRCGVGGRGLTTSTRQQSTLALFPGLAVVFCLFPGLLEPFPL